MNKQVSLLTILLLLSMLSHGYGQTRTPKQVQIQEVQIQGAHTQASETYVVKEGDTLEDIATKFDLKIEEIFALNNIKNEKAFSVGRTFNLSLNNLVMIEDALVNPLPLVQDSKPSEESSHEQNTDIVLKDFSAILASLKTQNTSEHYTGESWPAEYPWPLKTINFSTNEVKPGESFSISIELQEAATLQAHFVGQQFPFLKETDLTHTTFMAIPLSENAGLYPLDLEIQLADDTVQNLILPIVISKKSFETESASTKSINTLPINLQTQHSEANTIFDSCTEFEAERRWDSLFAKPIARDVTLDFAIRTIYEGSSAETIHTGLDFVANKGAKVFASANGIVRLAQDFDVRGKTIVLDHGLGVCTIYNYLDGITVEEGQEVSKGDPIGTLGSSGLVKLVHLHWEIRVMGIAVDPSIWMETE